MDRLRLAPTKTAVLGELALRTAQSAPADPSLRKKSGQLFCDASSLDQKELMGDQDNIAANLRAYVLGFSPEGSDIFDRSEIDILRESVA